MENNQVEEIVYRPASKGKRLLAALLDFALTILLSLTIFSISNILTKTAPFQAEPASIRQSIQVESGLYLEDGTLIYEYTAKEGTELATYREKKDFLSSRIDAFYNDRSFCEEKVISEYATRKLEAKKDDTLLFHLNEDFTVSENDVNPSYLYDFYVLEIQDHAMSYLYNKSAYGEATRQIFFVGVVEFLIGLVLSVLVFYALVPLAIFRRGRQTLGRKLLKISLISANALNVKAGRYWLRVVFIFFIYYILDFIGFLIPLMVSLGMLFFTKRKENLVDYLLSQYMVDTSVNEVYLDYGDYQEGKNAKEKAKLENRDFKLHE